VAKQSGYQAGDDFLPGLSDFPPPGGSVRHYLRSGHRGKRLLGDSQKAAAAV